MKALTTEKFLTDRATVKNIDAWAIKTHQMFNV